jgi:hypothetical protein
MVDTEQIVELKIFIKKTPGLSRVRFHYIFSSIK